MSPEGDGTESRGPSGPLSVFQPLGQPFRAPKAWPSMAIPACGPAACAAVTGWALAHHELHARLGPVSSLRHFVTSSLRRLKRRARAFGQPFGLPESLSLAWPRESNQREGHPSSAPSAHPCAEGSREAIGVFGQAIPGLSKTLAASLRPTLRADRPPPAAPQGPHEERGLLPARAGARSRAEAEAQAEAEAVMGWVLAHHGLHARPGHRRAAAPHRAARITG